MSSKPIVLTVVCTANICRSPMAAALLRHALNAETHAPPFRVESAGLAAHEGDPVSDNSVHALQKTGIDISSHRSRILTPERVAASTVIFGMTSGHLRMIETLFPAPLPMLRLFREFAPDGSPEVPDPFGASIDEYVQCRDSLVEAVPGVVRFLFQEVFPRPGSETR